MLLETRLFTGGHLRRLVVRSDEAGWDVREEFDEVLVRRLRLTEWHRVERAMRRFKSAFGHDAESGPERTNAA